MSKQSEYESEYIMSKQAEYESPLDWAADNDKYWKQYLSLISERGEEELKKRIRFREKFQDRPFTLDDLEVLARIAWPYSPDAQNAVYNKLKFCFGNPMTLSDCKTEDDYRRLSRRVAFEIEDHILHKLDNDIQKESEEDYWKREMSGSFHQDTSCEEGCNRPDDIDVICKIFDKYFDYHQKMVDPLFHELQGIVNLLKSNDTGFIDRGREELSTLQSTCGYIRRELGHIVYRARDILNQVDEICEMIPTGCKYEKHFSWTLEDSPFYDPEPLKERKKVIKSDPPLPLLDEDEDFELPF